jgi:hypothetical protein
LISKYKLHLSSKIILSGNNPLEQAITLLDQSAQSKDSTSTPISNNTNGNTKTNIANDTKSNVQEEEEGNQQENGNGRLENEEEIDVGNGDSPPSNAIEKMEEDTMEDSTNVK